MWSSALVARGPIYLPTPEPAAGEVTAAVKAAALNFFDTLIIAGKYQMKPAFPFSPAAEFAGVVDRVGSGVTTFRPGDRVAASMPQDRLSAWLPAKWIRPTGRMMCGQNWSHANGLLNPEAHMRKAITMEQALAGRPIADPLTVYDCSLISDGAAAVMLAPLERVAALVRRCE